MAGRALFFAGVDRRAGDTARLADGFEPGLGAVAADGCGRDDRATRANELAHARRVERVDRRHRRAIERGIQLAPLARRHHRPGRKPHRLQHHVDADRIGREHLAEQRHRRLVRALGRSGDRTRFGLGARVGEHGAREHVLGFGVGGHAEARHVDADHAHAVDLGGQQAERHARRGRDAEVGDDDRIVERGIGEFVHRIADVLEQLAGDERFGIKRYVADAAARAVEVAGERQAVNAAGGAREHGRGAPHPKADAERPEGGAHRLRLIVRALGVIGGIAREDLGLARQTRGRVHRVRGRVTAAALDGRFRGHALRQHRR